MTEGNIKIFFLRTKGQYFFFPSSLSFTSILAQTRGHISYSHTEGSTVPTNIGKGLLL